MNTTQILRAAGLKQFQELGEKLNQSLKRELKRTILSQDVLNAKVKRSYPRPKAA